MKFSFALSVLPAVAFLTSTVFAYPVGEAGSAFKARDGANYKELVGRAALGFDESLHSRTLVDKLKFWKKPKELSEEEKQAKISKMNKALSQKILAHHREVAKVRDGTTGGLKVAYHGPEEHKKLAEGQTHKAYRLFDDYKQFTHADVHVSDHAPGVKMITANFNNGNGGRGVNHYMFHHEEKKK